MNIISLFSGCGGLDLGFKKAGFNIIWANDNAPSVWETYEKNFSNVELDKRHISRIDPLDISNKIIGIIGGPPCQSWSNAGKGKGFEDKRGALFLDFIRIIDLNEPLFFIAENVEGITSKRNIESFNRIKELLENSGKSGYNLAVKVLNAADYYVPQNRKRIFLVGYRNDLNLKFEFPKKSEKQPTVKDAIKDIRNLAIQARFKNGNKTNGDKCKIPNHEYWVGDYSYIFMSRNRVLTWDKPSFTLQASGRQTSLHPKSPKMERISKDVMRFIPGKEHLYRRLTIRECARIQTFPDDFIFYYDTLNTGYKMIGNAVPVELSYALASKIFKDLTVLKLVNDIKKCEPNTDSIQQSSVLA